jgi:tetratricopeptide (TPR) repeat protein
MDKKNKQNKLKMKVKADKLYNQGNIYSRLHQYEKALEFHNKAIAIYKDPKYYNNRAATYKRLGLFQEAINDYDLLITEFPKYAKGYLSLASTYIEFNQYEKAIEFYKSFYKLYQNGFFQFNPIHGAVDQSTKGKSEIETIFLTSINYLFVHEPELAKLAVEAFKQATNIEASLQQSLADKPELSKLATEAFKEITNSEADVQENVKEFLNKDNLSSLPDLGDFLLNKNLNKSVIRISIKPEFVLVNTYPNFPFTFIYFASFFDLSPFCGVIWFDNNIWQIEYQQFFTSHNKIDLLISLWSEKKYRGGDGVQVVPFKVVNRGNSTLFLETSPELTELLCKTILIPITKAKKG